MGDTVTFPKTEIQVNGQFVAAQIGNATVIQDDSGNLWFAAEVEAIHVQPAEPDPKLPSVYD